MSRKKPIHPGKFIKSSIIPKDLSVKDAAELLGVGRPALSNLLNGNAALSQEMAFRIEKAFGSSAKELMEIQKKFDESEFKEEASTIAVKNYVPSFLSIRSRQIDDWADGIEARSRLGVFLRKLVNTTGSKLTKVDFPGYDNAERHGWDGEIESEAATPWIPLGKSGWEFGCTKDPLKKANGDYKARTSSIPPADREQINFVFVTPRHWADKSEWVKEKEKLKEWKSVRVFDANDLEQWLEQSIQAQSWLGEELGILKAVESLERHWENWASATEPKLPKILFEDSVNKYCQRVRDWLNASPASPLLVAADSRDEAIAFLACLFESEKFTRDRDRAVIFNSEEELSRLSSTTLPLIAIIAKENVQQKIGNIFRNHHTIIVTPRNSVERKPEIVLEQIGQTKFIKIMEAMGIDRADGDRLARESGYSPTILRRRLAVIDANRIPNYHKDDKAIQYLIPFTLIGAWHSQTSGDKEVLSYISNCSYDEVEKRIAYLQQFEENPVWSSGAYRGVSSKLESLFAVSNWITSADINNFFNVAKTVLSEEDPALELPEENRWAANLYGKTRNHSSTIRQRICETLTLLAINGDNLLKDRLGESITQKIDELIKNLMSPLSLNKVLSSNKDLTYFAEASPEVFLNIIEQDLKTDDPVTLQLMKPASSDLFSGGAIRTDLLWALEILAWNPMRLIRVCYILARLSTKVINDNYVNKPMYSLESIFRSWIPQTAADLEQRKKALASLVKKFPAVGWRICMAQFPIGHETGHYSHRPRWRNDASGFGEVVSGNERSEFIIEAFEIAVSIPQHSFETIKDLIKYTQTFPESYQIRVWELVENWVKENANAQLKAELRERIRETVFGFRKFKDQPEKVRNKVKNLFEQLSSEDPVEKYKWLFKEQWLRGAIEGLDEDTYDYKKRDQLIVDLRIKAVVEIWSNGFDALRSLIKSSGTPETIGWVFTKDAFNNLDEIEFVTNCLNEKDEQDKWTDLIRSFLHALNQDKRVNILRHFTNTESSSLIRLLLSSPCDKQTWDIVDSCNENVSSEYWQKVRPYYFLNEEDTNELIDRLLKVNRSCSAFQAIHLQYEKVETSRLKQILQRLPYLENPNDGGLQFTGYDLSKALSVLQQRAGVTEEEMANLEFVYIQVLDNSEHGIPNLQRQIIKSPILFVHALAMTYKRTDDGNDPEEWGLPDEKSRRQTFGLTYSLLQKIRMIPGVNEEGQINVQELKKWIFEVRELCIKHARAKVGDQSIGQILSAAPVGKDGIWPCEEVREVLEELASSDISAGIGMGITNSRGPVWGADGKAEEELAVTYNNWATQTAFEYPYVSQMLRDVAKSFERHAEWMQSKQNIEEKLGY
jgi:addiction module HigA family antidote